MKIEAVELLHADGGGRAFDYVKVTADNGQVGWSEYNESFGGLGVSATIEHLVPALIGQDPRAFEAIAALLYALRRPAASGIAQQAMGAIENALIDLKARALDVPVYELFGGPVRQRQRVYWSHCGTYRQGARARAMGVPELKSLEDVVSLGHEVVDRGFSALKTNVTLFDDGESRGHSPGFARGASWNPERYVLNAIREQLAAFREGVGKDVDILVDLNFNYKTEGYLRVAREMEPFDLFWVEIDTRNPAAQAYIRSRTTIPVAGGETLCGRREYRPYFEVGAMDSIIIDLPWNGFSESLKIAAMADAYEVNIAPHNFYSPLATAMSLHLCAVVPNVRIMEMDVDQAAWVDELCTNRPALRESYLHLPEGPGWGTTPDEAALRAHPAKPVASAAVPQPVGAR